MLEGTTLSAIFDDVLLRLHGPFRSEFLEAVLKIARRPGEHQTTMLLESWLGELPIELLRNDCWHRYYKINEPSHDRFLIASRTLKESWGEDGYVSLQNLSAIDFLKGFSDGEAMFSLAADSLWTMSNQELQDCLKAINRCLHRNGAVIVLGLVQSGNAILREHHFDRLKCRLPKIESMSQLLQPRLGSSCIRTEEEFAIMFLEAEFEYECICKSYPFQAWILTHLRKKRGADSLFAAY